MKNADAGPQLGGQWSRLPADPTLGATRMEFRSGVAIYEPESAASFLYFVDSGQVRTYQARPDDSARMLEILGSGEWFGEECLGRGETYSSRAVAATDAVLYAIAVERVLELLFRRPAVAVELIGRLADRLHASREAAGQFVFDDCAARLAKTLLRFSTSAAATLQSDGTVLLRITHRQLAQAVGAARETVSLALTQLRQKSLLRTGRNQLTFRPDALHAYMADRTARVPQRL